MDSARACTSIELLVQYSSDAPLVTLGPRSFILPPVPHGYPVPRLEALAFTRNLADRTGTHLDVSSAAPTLPKPPTAAKVGLQGCSL